MNFPKFRGPLKLLAAAGTLLLLWYVVQGPVFTLISGGVTLSGNTPAIVHDSQLVSHANPEKTIEIVVGLKLHDEGELDALIARQQDPDSPDYLQFLSREEFNRRFAPSQSDADEVQRYLTSQGLQIISVAPNRLLIHAQGRVSQLEKAFNVQINEYQTQTATGLQSFFSNDRDPVIPLHLKNVVQSIIGLDTISQFESRISKPVPDAQPAAPKPHRRGAGQDPLSPQDVAGAYNFPNNNNGHVGDVKFSGKGVKVAIATAYGYSRQDIQTYWSRHNIKRGGQLIDKPVNGSTNKLEEETTLDVEVLSSQVPDADVLMYIGHDPSFVTFALTFNQVVVDNEASVMTVSWGLCEKRSGWLVMQTEHAIFKQAVAQGISLFVSAGDDGAYDCGGKKPDFAVDFPSSDPQFTAVGGTSLEVRNSGRTSEWAWTGSGGGVSNNWTRPSWQTAVNLPAGDMRLSSDVAMNADPYTGYSFYFGGNWGRIGGTSASAPAWASLWTLAVESAGKRLGSANPFVYRIGNNPDYGKIFFDVTKGNNGAGRGPGFVAGTGWDHPTGWGAPDGTAVVDYVTRTSVLTPGVNAAKKGSTKK